MVDLRNSRVEEERAGEAGVVLRRGRGSSAFRANERERASLDSGGSDGRGWPRSFRSTSFWLGAGEGGRRTFVASPSSLALACTRTPTQNSTRNSTS